jgi:hypothetical protein
LGGMIVMVNGSKKKYIKTNQPPTAHLTSTEGLK